MLRTVKGRSVPSTIDIHIKQYRQAAPQPSCEECVSDAREQIQTDRQIGMIEFGPLVYIEVESKVWSIHALLMPSSPVFQAPERTPEATRDGARRWICLGVAPLNFQ